MGLLRGEHRTAQDRLQPGSHFGYQDVGERLEARVGLKQLSGRYHKSPRTLPCDYTLTDVVLGSGFNGDVRLASSKTYPDHKFAVKNFSFAGVPLCKREQLEMEVEVFLSIDHPHIARLMDVYEHGEQTAIVMEYMEGGELFERLARQKRFQESTASSIARQMLLALNYIHMHGIIHGDVKLENFMFNSKDANHLKLIDFGFSKMVSDVTAVATQSKLCGTMAYLAPEVLERTLSSQCDQWSLGVVVFVLLTGHMPFTGTKQEILKNISVGKYRMKEETKALLSEDAKCFIQALLHIDPKQRISARAALDHPFIAGMNMQQEKSEVCQSVAEALCDFRRQSGFRRQVLSMIAWSLSYEECSKVEQFFLEIDEHHNGAITFDELQKVLVGKFKLPAREARKVFEALDTHRDHEIHYSDFLAAMVSHNEIALHEEHVYDAFRKFDTHDAGYITVDDLREVLGDRVAGERVESVLREVDPLNLGKITYQEFVSYVRGRPLHVRGDEIVPPLDACKRHCLPSSFRCQSQHCGSHPAQACCSVQ